MSIWTEAPDLPSSRDEAWRYTPLDKVFAVPFTDTGGGAVGADIEREVQALVEHLAADLGGMRLVYANGSLVEALSRTSGIDGVRCDIAPAAADHAEDDRLKDRATLATRIPHEGFEGLNRAGAFASATITIDAQVEVAHPIQIIHVALPAREPNAVHPRTTVALGARSQATVVETYLGSPGEVLVNASTHIDVGEGATLTHHRIQAGGEGAMHVARTRIAQWAESTVGSSTINLGSAVAREALDVEFRGDGAVADLAGLYVPRRDQHHDHVVTVDHAASRCTSIQKFKGIVDDKARGSFTGHVIVRPGTVKTDTTQSNRGLLLDRTAQIDTRPWLEILADDVRATHGATVGRLDDAALFYMRSRGIPENRARELLIAAFADEVVDAIEPEAVRDQVRTIITAVRGSVTPGGDQ